MNICKHILILFLLVFNTVEAATTTIIALPNVITPKFGLAFTTTTPAIQNNNIIKNSKVVIDKLELVNQESEFTRNIPYNTITNLIKSYVNSINILSEAKQLNQITLEITYTPNNQSFNMNTKTPVSNDDYPVYQKVFSSLQSISKPDVKETLTLMIFAHTESVK